MRWPGRSAVMPSSRLASGAAVDQRELDPAGGGALAGQQRDRIAGASSATGWWGASAGLTGTTASISARSSVDPPTPEPARRRAGRRGARAATRSAPCDAASPSRRPTRTSSTWRATCRCGAAGPPSDALRGAGCQSYDAGAMGLSARFLHHRNGWPPTRAGVRLSRAGPVSGPAARSAEYTIAHGRWLAIAAGGTCNSLNRANRSLIPISGFIAQFLRQPLVRLVPERPTVGSSSARHRGRRSPAPRPRSSAGQPTCAAVNQAAPLRSIRRPLGHHRLGAARRPAPDRSPVRRASPSAAPPGRARPGLCRLSTASTRSIDPAQLPGLLDQFAQQPVGRLLAVIGAAAGQVPPPGTRDTRRDHRSSSTRPAGSVTSPYAAKRCRRCRRAPTRRRLGVPGGRLGRLGGTCRPSSSAVNGISGSPAASCGVHQASSWLPTGRLRSDHRRRASDVEDEPVGVQGDARVPDGGRRSATAARDPVTATASPVSSANSRTTVSPGARRARRPHRAAASAPARAGRRPADQQHPTASPAAPRTPRSAVAPPRPPLPAPRPHPSIMRLAVAGRRVCRRTGTAGGHGPVASGRCHGSRAAWTRLGGDLGDGGRWAGRPAPRGRTSGPRRWSRRRR